MRNTRRYGGYIVHMGMVLVFIGLAGAAFNRDVQKEMQMGATHADRAVQACAPELRHQARKELHRPSPDRRSLRDNKPLMMLYPERRIFATTERNGNDGSDLLDSP